MKYLDATISKREHEVILFLQTGSHNFWDAYYNYNQRKLRADRPSLTIVSWFNSTIKSLHDKKLFLHVNFVLIFGFSFSWRNPGINASKANYQAITLHDAQMELKAELNKIL